MSPVEQGKTGSLILGLRASREESMGLPPDAAALRRWLASENRARALSRMVEMPGGDDESFDCRR